MLPHVDLTLFSLLGQDFFKLSLTVNKGLEKLFTSRKPIYT